MYYWYCTSIIIQYCVYVGKILAKVSQYNMNIDYRKYTNVLPILHVNYSILCLSWKYIGQGFPAVNIGYTENIDVLLLFVIYGL